MRVVRTARPEDASALAEIFYLGVRRGARLAYSEAQCAAWCPEVPSGEDWAGRLSGLDIVLSEVSGQVVGFMALDVEKALLDLVYVHPDHVRAGHASALYAVIEGRARRAGLTTIETEASRLAEPFFLAQGWRVVARQEVERRGVMIPNARMEKVLVRLPEGMAAEARAG